jgi:hypothetical protein
MAIQSGSDHDHDLSSLIKKLLIYSSKSEVYIIKYEYFIRIKKKIDNFPKFEFDYLFLFNEK